MLSHWDEETLEQIEQIAYFKWIDAGRPSGMHQHFWDLAEKEMLEKTAGIEEVVEISYRKPKRKGWGHTNWGHVTITTGSGGASTVSSGTGGMVTITGTGGATGGWYINDPSYVYRAADRVAYGSRNPSPSAGNNEVPINNPPPVYGDNDFVDLTTGKKGNDRYKVHDRDIRQVLSDNAVKDMIAEIDQSLSYQFDSWGE
jgi:hypothetical protein